MYKKLIILFAIFFISTSFVFARGISRDQIQQLFADTPGNASYLPSWQQTFLNKGVNWKGIIFSIQYQKSFDRTEVTMKVLPETMMYDTVVFVPGDITDKFNIRDEVNFSGSITRGIDMLGVKEVQVKVGKNLGDNFGDYVFSDQGMVNVNFLNK